MYTRTTEYPHASHFYHFVFAWYATFLGAYILLSSEILGVRTTEIARTSKTSVQALKTCSGPRSNGHRERPE